MRLIRASSKLSLVVASLGTGAAIAGLGTYAQFRSTTSASHSIASGTVAITLGAAGGAGNRLTISASSIIPGDAVRRAVDLANGTGNQALASITLTTSATTSSVLDTDASLGLQMNIDRCPTAWIEAGTAPAYTYTCSPGPSTVVLAPRRVIGSNLALTNLSAVNAGNTDHLVVTLTLPNNTADTFQAKSSTISYAFVGTQRAAAAH